MNIRISQLTIVHASVRRDHGTYECRAMNVVSKEPSVKRFHVNVQWPINHPKHRQSLGNYHHHQNNGKHRHPSSYSGIRKTTINNDDDRIGAKNNVIIGTNHHYNINHNHHHQILNNNDDVESDEIHHYHPQVTDDGFNSFQDNSEIPQPCPIASFCLNGGTCSLYKHLGEYVCECADGYKGHRCEYKDLQKYPVKTLVDYDPIVARTPPHSFSASLVQK
ncbi:negative regulator of glucose-controlled proteins [Dermatophagoides farinae]|uniref:Negative regulator of glucose-controlled proteins n=1 Tax=Dermatophagoides farinae TaxID=6954 RepID=A0A922HQ42_DERFA|nr:negative regulator of glucose-controlled proteins [Dermatophagoides farinae]